MKFLLNIGILILFATSTHAENDLNFFINSALKNNLELNAERKNKKSIKQNINISRSEFLPSLSVSGNQTSTETSKRTNKSGASLSDTNNNSETATVSVTRKFFKDLKVIII